MRKPATTTPFLNHYHTGAAMLPSHLFRNRPASAYLALLLHLQREMEQIDAQLETPLSRAEMASPASIAIAGTRRSGLDALHKHYWNEAMKAVRALLRSKAGRVALADAGFVGDTPEQILAGTVTVPHAGVVPSGDWPDSAFG